MRILGYVNKYGGLNENGAHSLTFELVELFGKDEEVWLCWRRYVLEIDFEASRALSYYSSTLAVCLLNGLCAAMLPATMIMN